MNKRVLLDALEYFRTIRDCLVPFSHDFEQCSKNVVLIEMDLMQ